MVICVSNPSRLSCGITDNAFDSVADLGCELLLPYR